MTILSTFGGGSVSVDTGDIGHSLRFRSAASAYLNRTPGAGSTTAWALSLWVKRGALGTERPLFAATSSGTNYNIFEFNSSDQLYFVNRPSGGVNVSLTTTRVFRDPTSWIHLFLVYDSANATQTDRVRLEVNGVRETSFSSPTWPTSSLASIIETAIAHYIGNSGLGAFADQYMSRIAFITGNGSLSASSVGYLNTEINEWVSKTQAQVKAVVDAGGANSFMLDFDDGTSLTTLGYDKVVHSASGTANGNAQTTTAQFKYGSSSAVFDGTGDSVYLGTNAVISATGDWTAEAWVRFNSTTGFQYIFGQGTGNNPECSFNLGKDANHKLIAYAYSGGTAYASSVSATAINPGQWYHIVVTRDGATLRTYLDGVQQGTVSLSGVSINLAAGFNMSFGAAGSVGSFMLNGWGQDFRVYSGVCKYPSGTTFTPPSGFLPSIDSDPNGASVTLAAQLTGANAGTSFPYSFRNNWALNNFSLTAGTSYDWMLDVPGNSFATLNPLASANNGTISNANLSYYYGSTSNSGAVPTIECPQNTKTYVEVYIGTMARAQIGITSYQPVMPSSMVSASVIGSDSTLAYYSLNGVCSTGATTRFTGSTYTSGNTIGMAIDTTVSPATVQYYLDNVAQGTPVSSLTTTGPVYVYMNTWLGTDYVFSAGQAPLHASATYHSAAGGYFRYAPPTGYKALCQRNIPDGETITTSGSFTGTLAADGPCIDIKGVPTAMTINGNAVTFGTHADKLSSGFKLRTASSSYNNTGSNTYSITSTGAKRKYSLAQGNP